MRCRIGALSRLGGDAQKLTHPREVFTAVALGEKAVVPDAMKAVGQDMQEKAAQELVRAKPPFGGPQRVLAYLARYTHRTAIGNSRLVDVTDAQVAFRYKNYRRGGRSGVMQLGAHEFLRRFLLHVLPDGFHRIRHYGFLAKGDRGENLARVRVFLHVAPEPRESADPAAQAEKSEADAARSVIALCPDCGGLMRRIEIVTPPPTGAFRCDTS